MSISGAAQQAAQHKGDHTSSEHGRGLCSSASLPAPSGWTETAFGRDFAVRVFGPRRTRRDDGAAPRGEADSGVCESRLYGLGVIHGRERSRPRGRHVCCKNEREHARLASAAYTRGHDLPCLHRAPKKGGAGDQFDWFSAAWLLCLRPCRNKRAAGQWQWWWRQLPVERGGGWGQVRTGADAGPRSTGLDSPQRSAPPAFAE